MHALQVKAGLDAILESVSRALEAGLGLDYGTVTTEEVRRQSELDIGTVKHRPRVHHHHYHLSPPLRPLRLCTCVPCPCLPAQVKLLIPKALGPPRPAVMKVLLNNRLR